MKAKAVKAKATKAASGHVSLRFLFETGATITQDMKTSDRVGQVLKDLSCQPGSKLMFDGKQLEESRTLSDYNIQENSTLHIVFPTRAPRTPDARKEPRYRVRYAGARPDFMWDSKAVFDDDP